MLLGTPLGVLVEYKFSLNRRKKKSRDTPFLFFICYTRTLVKGLKNLPIAPDVRSTVCGVQKGWLTGTGYLEERQSVME